MSPDEVESLYLEHRPLLLRVAQKFDIPVSDAEAIVHDVMFAYITTTTPIRNPKAWLIAATCNASRKQWRHRASNDGLECERADQKIGEMEVARFDRELVRFERELILAKILSLLRQNDREILRLHYFERLTASQIGKRLNTTARYAEKLIWKALRRARKVYAELQQQFSDRKAESDQQQQRVPPLKG